LLVFGYWSLVIHAGGQRLMRRVAVASNQHQQPATSN
jgi:hypothetical protein